MKISNDTIDELFNVIKLKLTNAELKMLFHRFSITGWESESTSPKMIANVIPFIQKSLNNSINMGRFVEHVLSLVEEKENESTWSTNTVKPLSVIAPKLFNSLLRDGYKVENYRLLKIAPEMIEDDQIPDELMKNLIHFSLTTAIGHFEQAKENYKLGNWSAANAMIRSFFEAILIYINDTLNPTSPTTAGGDAINKLSQSGFFKNTLNETDNSSQPYGFIGGLWKMLHPHGSHPGLSEEEDSTFRFHMIIVVANYYLKRLKNII